MYISERLLIKRRDSSGRFKEEGFTPYGYVTWLYTWACYLQTVYLVQRSPVSPAHYVTAGKGVK